MTFQNNTEAKEFSELNVTVDDEFLMDINYTTSILKVLKNRRSLGIGCIKE